MTELREIKGQPPTHSITHAVFVGLKQHPAYINFQVVGQETGVVRTGHTVKR